MNVDRLQTNLNRARISPDKNKISLGLNNTIALISLTNEKERKLTTELDVTLQSAPENPYWTELKTSGKNISKRCYHISVIYDNK